MRHYEMPRHNGHSGPRMPTHPSYFDMPRRGSEMPPMAGASYQRMRVIFFANEAGARGAPWTEDDAPLTIIGDEAAATPVPAVRTTSIRHFPEPGREVAAAWGDVRGLVADKLTHPERLRDSHLLRCYAQVYEAVVPQRIEALATAMLGDAALVSELRPLTDQLAARLSLVANLPRRPPRAPQRREPGALLAGDRVIRLRVAEDVTGDAEASEQQDPMPPALQAKRPPPQPLAPLPRAVRPAAIPEKYQQPWEFRRSREEAVYEMHFAARPPMWRRLLRMLQGPTVSRREFLRWEIMVSGKELEEQLWGVRPPAGGLRHPKVRDWAARTLALAGYEPGIMLAEWEIHWRRKAD